MADTNLLLSANVDVLPDSRLATPFTPKGGQWRDGAWWVPIFCANCGADGGLVPQENMTFAFYLCNPCFETYGTIAGTYAMPDEVFWAKLQEAQLERHGRLLSNTELVAALADESDPVSRLAKDRLALTPVRS